MTQEKLPAHKQKAISALVETNSPTKAADAAGVQRQTVHKWMRDPDFKEALTRAEFEALRAIGRELVNVSQLAVEVLAGVMEDETATHNAKLRAAGIVLDKTVKLHEVATLDDRLAVLEKRIEEILSDGRQDAHS